MILAACRCLDCDPSPSRLGCSATPWSRTTSAAAPTAATRLLVGGVGRPDTSLCAACEYRRYLAASGGRDLANQERARWASHPSHALSLFVPATAACHYGEQRSMIQASWEESADEPVR
jgi:hypothetical protein